MKRYYTFESINNSPYGQKLFQLGKFAKKKGVTYNGYFDDCSEYLEKHGVYLLHKSSSIESFDFGQVDDNTADELEQEIKDFAETLQIRIIDVRAYLDYDKILTLAVSDLFEGDVQILLEDVIIPNTAEDYEARVMRYINELHSQGKTLILTDPYLFMSRESDYINELDRLLRGSGAGKIVCFMPQRCQNATYTDITSRLSSIKFEFHEYDDCHDRFWLCPEEKTGFCMGTSLNGLGRKICRIDMLELVEVEVLLKELA